MSRYRAKNIDWEAARPLFESQTDDEIAAHFKCSRTRVARVRQGFGIIRANTARAGVDWDNVTELGKLSDTVVGHLHSVHRTTVRQARETRGIQPALVDRVQVEIPTELADRIMQRHPTATLGIAAMLTLQELLG